jgi:hypothetical protein
VQKIVAPVSGIYHGVYPATAEGDETSVSLQSLSDYLSAVKRDRTVPSRLSPHRGGDTVRGSQEHDVGLSREP